MAKTKDHAHEDEAKTKDHAHALRLVKMTRPHPTHKGGPTTADVHPSEVANYAAGGWLIAKEK